LDKFWARKPLIFKFFWKANNFQILPSFSMIQTLKTCQNFQRALTFSNPFLATAQKRHPTGICPGTPSLQHSDLPTTVSRKHAYADDLAIMHADGDWKAMEGVLSKDMATTDEYLQTWKLKLSTTKLLRQSSTSTTKPCPFAPNPSTSE